MRIIIIISLFMLGCTKSQEYTVTIRKGQRTDPRLPQLYVNAGHLSYLVEFMPSCHYDLGKDQGDINKLFGFGYMPAHRENSIRFGWWYNPEADSIAIMAYWYDNGKRDYAFLRHVALSDVHQYTIVAQGDMHMMSIDHRLLKTVIVKRSGLSYGLFPYFGGSHPAPNDIHIKMRRL
jgi:hypothetical protein